MSDAIKITPIEGDLALGRNLTMGGDLLTQGNGKVKKDLTVEGWLKAKNIQNFGSFTLEELAKLIVNGYLLINGNKIFAGYADSAGNASTLGDGVSWKNISQALSEKLSRISEDSAQEIINFIKGIRIGDGTYSIDKIGNAILNSIKANELFLGDFEHLLQGIGLYKNTSGHWCIECDDAYFRMKAVFEALEIRKTYFSGGNMNLSPSGSKVTKVIWLDSEGNEIDQKTYSWNGDSTTEVIDASGNTLTVAAFKCEIKTDDGTMATTNTWCADSTNGYDMAICKTSNIKEGVYENVKTQYYWRVVTAVGDRTVKKDNLGNIVTDTNGNSLYNEAFVTLGNGDGQYDAGSTVPLSGDEIVARGNTKSGSGRNSYIELLSTDDDGYAPALMMWADVRGFTSTTKGTRTSIISPKKVEFATQMFRLIGYDGKTTRPVPFDRGDWNSTTRYYFYDRVRCDGSTWILDKITDGASVEPGNRPSKTSQYWSLEVEKGADGVNGTGTKMIEWYALSSSATYGTDFVTDSATGTRYSDATILANLQSAKDNGTLIWSHDFTAPDETKKYLWNIEQVITVKGATEDSYTFTTPHIDAQLGENGRGVSSITNTYLALTTNTLTDAQKTDATLWHTYDEVMSGKDSSGNTINQWNATNVYLWNKTTTIYTDNTTSSNYTYIHFVQDGRGIVSIANYYLALDATHTDTELTALSGFTDYATAVKEWNATKKYLYNKIVIAYNEEPKQVIQYTYTVWNKGDNGDKGDKGDDAITLIISPTIAEFAMKTDAYGAYTGAVDETKKVSFVVTYKKGNDDTVQVPTLTLGSYTNLVSGQAPTINGNAIEISGSQVGTQSISYKNNVDNTTGSKTISCESGYVDFIAKCGSINISGRARWHCDVQALWQTLVRTEQEYNSTYAKLYGTSGDISQIKQTASNISLKVGSISLARRNLIQDSMRHICQSVSSDTPYTSWDITVEKGKNYVLSAEGKNLLMQIHDAGDSTYTAAIIADALSIGATEVHTAASSKLSVLVYFRSGTAQLNWIQLEETEIAANTSDANTPWSLCKTDKQVTDNLLLGSRDLSSGVSASGADGTYTDDSGNEFVTYYTNAGGEIFITDAIELEVDLYTFSFLAKADVDAQTFAIGLYNASNALDFALTSVASDNSCNTSNNSSTIALTTSWKRYYITYRVTKAGTGYFQITANNTMTFAAPKLCKSGRWDDWTNAIGYDMLYPSGFDIFKNYIAAYANHFKFYDNYGNDLACFDENGLTSKQLRCKNKNGVIVHTINEDNENGLVKRYYPDSGNILMEEAYVYDATHNCIGIRRIYYNRDGTVSYVIDESEEKMSGAYIGWKPEEAYESTTRYPGNGTTDDGSTLSKNCYKNTFVSNDANSKAYNGNVEVDALAKTILDGLGSPTWYTGYLLDKNVTLLLSRTTPTIGMYLRTVYHYVDGKLTETLTNRTTKEYNGNFKPSE